MDAANVPTRRRASGVESTNFDMGQKPSIDLSLDKTPEVPAIEAIHADALVDGKAEALAFNEEPVEIMIYPSAETNAPLVVDCWVNGRGAEIFTNGKWVQAGCLPVGMNVITRRKYAEVLMRAKRDTISTQHEDAVVERPKNVVNRSSSAVANLQIVRDNNPKGIEWVRRLMAQPG